MSMTLSREELYLLVWNLPLIHLGAALGISGNAVAKACQKRGIPMPGRDYWGRKRHGQDPEKIPLPEMAGPVPVLRVREAHAERIQGLLDELKERADEHTSPMASAVKEVSPPRREPIDDGRGATIEPQAMSHRSTSTAPREQRVARSSVASLSQAPATADQLAMPQYATLRQLAEQLDVRRSVERLIVAIEQAQGALDPATRAPVQLWVQAARQALGPVDPVTEVVGLCQRIAAGLERPFW